MCAATAQQAACILEVSLGAGGRVRTVKYRARSHPHAIDFQASTEFAACIYQSPSSLCQTVVSLQQRSVLQVRNGQFSLWSHWRGMNGSSPFVNKLNTNFITALYILYYVTAHSSAVVCRGPPPLGGPAYCQ